MARQTKTRPRAWCGSSSVRCGMHCKFMNGKRHSNRRASGAISRWYPIRFRGACNTNRLLQSTARAQSPRCCRSCCLGIMRSTRILSYRFFQIRLPTQAVRRQLPHRAHLRPALRHRHHTCSLEWFWYATGYVPRPVHPDSFLLTAPTLHAKTA